MSEIDNEFQARVLAALAECHRLGYHPTDFERMLEDARASRVAEKLVLSGEVQSGFKRLAEMHRLDLTVEAIMIEPQFESLFKPAIREAARWRLNQVKNG
jgi:hypothetical protein